MDLKRKIELMRKYDFGGFKGRVACISNGIIFLPLQTSPEKAEETCKDFEVDFEWLKSKYDGIDFKGLEAEIEEPDKDDFSTLFKTRELLPKLKSALDNLIKYLREHNYKISDKDPVYAEAELAIVRINKADGSYMHEFRRKRQKLEGKV